MSTAPEATRDATRTAPPNWYPDPREPGQLRWWSGIAWTQHVAPLPPPGQRPVAGRRPADAFAAGTVRAADRAGALTDGHDSDHVDRDSAAKTATETAAESAATARGRRALDAPVDAPGSVPRKSDVPLHSAAISLPYLVTEKDDAAKDGAATDDAPTDHVPAARAEPTEDDGIDDAADTGQTVVSARTAPAAGATALGSTGASTDDAALTIARVRPRTGPIETVPVSTGPIGTRRRRSTAATPVQASTLAGWVIALSPVLFLGAGVAAWISGTRTGIDYAFIALLVAPYAITVLLAVADRVSLRRLGHRRAPSWAWALLTPLAYLIARVAAVGRPAVLWTWCVLAVLGGVAAAVGIALSLA